MEYLHIVNVWSTKNSSYMKEILSNIQCHTFFLIRKWSIDPFLSILVAMVFILEVKPRRPVSQFQASLTKLSALLQVVVQFRYNVEL